MSTCYRCEGDIPADEKSYFVTVAETRLKFEREFWEAIVCRTCASIICAVLDDRPVFSKGSHAKFNMGPRDSTEN